MVRQYSHASSPVLFFLNHFSSTEIPLILFYSVKILIKHILLYNSGKNNLINTDSQRNNPNDDPAIALRSCENNVNNPPFKESTIDRIIREESI